MYVIKYKYKEIEFDYENKVIMRFYTRSNLRYSEKMSIKSLRKMYDLIRNRENGKVKSIDIIMFNKFVNFRVQKKGFSMFMPIGVMEKTIRIVLGMVS